MSDVIKPCRVQLSREKGFKLQETSRSLNGLQALKVDRTTSWGNPYPVNPRHSARESVEKFRRYLYSPIRTWMRELAREKLKGKNLACWCELHAPCHADVLLEVANGPDYPCHIMAPKHWCDQVFGQPHTCTGATPFSAALRRLEVAARTGDNVLLHKDEPATIYYRLCRLNQLEDLLRRGEIQSAVALAAQVE